MMSAYDLVDAAFAGLDRGEIVTIPALHENDAWTRSEHDRHQLASKIRDFKPAPSYEVACLELAAPRFPTGNCWQRIARL